MNPTNETYKSSIHRFTLGEHRRLPGDPAVAGLLWQVRDAAVGHAAP